MNEPIGIFDSGIGGLTVVKQLTKLLPNENYIYFGDTARVPYGTRSNRLIKQYAFEDFKTQYFVDKTNIFPDLYYLLNSLLKINIKI